MYIVPVFIPHAGCRHECTFCNQKIISGQSRFDFKSVELQIERFISLLPQGSDKQVAFYGGSFTALDQELQIRLLQHVKKRQDKDHIKSIRVSTRPDCIDTEGLKTLKEYGVEIIELGIQAMDNKVLELAKRGHGKEIVLNAVELIKKAEIKVGVQLMVGMQGQDWKSIISSTNLVLTLKPDMARIYSLMVLKGTELEKMYIKNEFAPKSLQETIAQASYILQKLKENNIPVIRIGLQAEECLQENIIAGEYHPAFGEMVSQHYYQMLVAKFCDDLPGKIRITVKAEYPTKLTSKIIGIRQYNKKFFAKAYPNITINWCENNELVDLKLSFEQPRQL
ncbi:elongator complex protein 3 [Succinispira mobilis]|uniref:elongator complex protein 3 n=1 Tax=Succinispira mobilis TaxID=78120 RepID=UPI000382CBFA|nr:radical SAM protein [Succinispira mobilis]